MKNKFYLKRAGLTIISAFFFCTSFAQSSDVAKQSPSNKIFAIWYESPHDGTNGNTVYLRNKYVPVPGIDKQEEAFKMLIINNDGTFVETQYCGYCPELKLKEKKGSYEILQQSDSITNLKISFPNETSTTIFKVIVCSENKLVLNLQHANNPK